VFVLQKPTTPVARCGASFLRKSLERVSETVVSRVAVSKQIYLNQRFAKRRHKSGMLQR
jgi:hypothetical protein